MVENRMIMCIHAWVSLSGIMSRTRQTHRRPEPCAGGRPLGWAARRGRGPGERRPLLAKGLASNRLTPDLPRLRGRAVGLASEMPCRLDGEPMPTPGEISVLAGAWRVLSPSPIAV